MKASKAREYDVSFGQHSLGSDIDLKALRDDEFWVIGKTALLPAIMADENGKVLRFTLLPLREFRLQHLGERPGVIPVLWWMTNRMRNYLAYFCQSPVPIAFRLLGKSLVVPKAADLDPLGQVPASLMEDYLLEKTTDEEMARKLEVMYDRTQRFLATVKPDSFIDRAIINAGDAFWARDPMDGFLQCWKAIEAVADMDFHSARTDYEATLVHEMTGYLEPADLERLKVRVGSVSKAARIKAAVSKRAPKYHSVIDDLERLRNAIAHGEVTPEKFKRIVTRRSETAAVARALIESSLAETTG